MAINRFTLHRVPTLGLMLLPPGILAHHSTAIFDQSKEFSIEGTVYEVRAGGATSFYERQNFTPEDFPIGGKVSASGYFIPERGNLIYPHNIWTDTRDLYNQVRAINSAREHLGWPPKEFDRTEGNRPNRPE